MCLTLVLPGCTSEKPSASSSASEAIDIQVLNQSFAVEELGTQPLSSEVRRKGQPVAIDEDMKKDMRVVKLTLDVKNTTPSDIEYISYDQIYYKADNSTVDSEEGFEDKILADERYACAFTAKDAVPFQLKAGAQSTLVLYDLVSTEASAQISKIGSLQIYGVSASQARAAVPTPTQKIYAVTYRVTGYATPEDVSGLSASAGPDGIVREPKATPPSRAHVAYDMSGTEHDLRLTSVPWEVSFQAPAGTDLMLRVGEYVGDIGHVTATIEVDGQIVDEENTEKKPNGRIILSHKTGQQ